MAVLEEARAPLPQLLKYYVAVSREFAVVPNAYAFAK
jgi:hypothetical protein